jgi:hypothetical protein
VRGTRRQGRRNRSVNRSADLVACGPERGARLEHSQGSRRRLRPLVRGSRRSPAQGHPRDLAALRSCQPNVGIEMDPEGVEPSISPSDSPQLPPRHGRFAELSAIGPMNPGQGFEPRPPRSERGVLPARRSRNVVQCEWHARRKAGRCCPSHSPTLRPWIAGRKHRCGVLRGGALEPGAPELTEIRRQKPRLIQQRIQPARSAEGPFSLGRGLESDLGFLKLGITPCRLWAETTKATLSDRLRSVVMWLET